jgi:hypothetical protein
MERIVVSRGAWADFLALMRLSNETHRAENRRWFGVTPPQYLMTYHNDEPVAARLMGTAIVLVPEGGEG